MHVIRPKSAKGRTRPKVTEARTAHDEDLHENRSFCPHPPFHPPHPPSTQSTGFDSSPPSCTFYRQSKSSSAVENAHDVPLRSLNKYKVLPCIEKRTEDAVSGADMEGKSSRSRLFTGHYYRSDGEIERASRGSLRVTPWCLDGETGVLLALRTPCGQRLKCQFQPTDTLRDVVATAEDKSGKRYQDVQIETMDVPRRSFTDLNMTLSQCDIVNKSVLCISFKDNR